MTFVPVRTIDEVLALALPPSEAPPLPADTQTPDAGTESAADPAATDVDEPSPVAVRGPGAPQP
jgi:hypothetical protein